MTENQLRQKIVDTAVAWLGCKESDRSRNRSLTFTTPTKPLARGYKVKYTDAWCSTYASAWAYQGGDRRLSQRSAGAKSILNCSRNWARGRKRRIHPENGRLHFL